MSQLLILKQLDATRRTEISKCKLKKYLFGNKLSRGKLIKMMMFVEKTWKEGLSLFVIHQSIETPTLWVPGKGRGFDIDPGLRLEFRPNAPTPEATKMKISKFQKKDMYLNGALFQLYTYKYTALIKLSVQLQLIINKYVC